MGNDSVLSADLYLLVGVYAHRHLITGSVERRVGFSYRRSWSNMEKAALGEPGCVLCALIILNDAFISSYLYFFSLFFSCLD